MVVPPLYRGSHQTVQDTNYIQNHVVVHSFMDNNEKDVIEAGAPH